MLVCSYLRILARTFRQLLFVRVLCWGFSHDGTTFLACWEMLTFTVALHNLGSYEARFCSAVCGDMWCVDTFCARLHGCRTGAPLLNRNDGAGTSCVGHETPTPSSPLTSLSAWKYSRYSRQSNKFELLALLAYVHALA